MKRRLRILIILRWMPIVDLFYGITTQNQESGMIYETRKVWLACWKSFLKIFFLRLTSCITTELQEAQIQK